MKNSILPLLIVLTFCFTNCKKNKTVSNLLPPATQDGKNTLGFLLNGQLWKPEGFNGTANLSLYYDPLFSAGVFNLAAYKIFNTTGSRQRITFFGDTIQTAQKIFLPSKRFGFVFRDNISGCDYDTTDSSENIILGGFFDIQKLDKINGIFAGVFDIKIKKNGCQDIQMINGRFDMKF